MTYQEEKIPNDKILYINKENKKYSQKIEKEKWYGLNPHPPFCRLANIHVGKYFLKLIDKHFKHNNILHKIFNRKTLKISYSCTKNIFEIINNHNKEIIKEFHDRMNNNNNNNNNNSNDNNNDNNNTSKRNKCNCQTRKNCPMNGLCNLDNVVYQGIIYPNENVNDIKTYIGICSTKLKLRYNNHSYSFFHEHLKNQTALSKQFWRLKNKGLTPEIQWSILKKSNTPEYFDSRCILCLEEKIQIMINPDPGKLLNQKCDLIARCRHRNKFKL